MLHRHIYERLPPEMQAKVHIFNSFFYTKISAKSPRGSSGGSGSSEGSTGKAQRNFESVRKWTQVGLMSSGGLLPPAVLALLAVAAIAVQLSLPVSTLSYSLRPHSHCSVLRVLHFKQGPGC